MSKYRQRIYTEDSTKGMSKINPKTYKRDVLMQVWMQSRHLATLLKWFDNEGVIVRFRSEIVQRTVEQVVEHLVKNGIVEMVEFSDDAVEILNRFDASNNPSGRGEKNVLHNLTLDDRRREREERYNPDFRHSQDNLQPQETNEPEEETMDELVARGTKIYNEKLAKEKEEELKRQEDRIKDSYVVDKEGIVRFKGEKNDKSPIGEEKKRKFDEEQELRDKEWEEEQRKKKELALDEKKKEKETVKAQGIVSRLESVDIRVRSDEEILEDRVRKDKEQDRLLSQM